MNNPLQNILPGERADELLSIATNKAVRNHSFYISEGEIPTKVAFVYSGLFRYVYINAKGDEFTKAIVKENNFISSYSAMIQRHPSYFFVQALENAEILEIKWSSFERLLDSDTFWLKFLMRIIERAYIVKEKRERDLLLLDAESRYRNFLEEFPGLDQRVTQGIIASYLGIKPETLSRIRRRITF